MILLYFSWPQDAGKAHALVKVSLIQVDWFGTALLLLFTTLFTLSIQQAGSRVYAWNSATIVALLTIGCAAFLGLLAWSWFLSRTTMPKFERIAGTLPWRIISNRVLVASIM